jgi:hypothetical protein
MPVGLSPKDGSTNEIRIGCNIHQLPQRVSILLTAKRCLVWPPISLTTRSLSRSALAGAEGKSPVHRHAFARFALGCDLH